MRTTLDLDNQVVDRAREATGIESTTALLRAGLEALASRAGVKKLLANEGRVPARQSPSAAAHRAKAGRAEAGRPEAGRVNVQTVVLVDTSVWIDALNGRRSMLDHVPEASIRVHEFIVGELMLWHWSPDQ